MENLPFNLFDIGVAAILLLSGLLAFFRGFVKELLSVGAWVGAAVATLYAFPHVQPYTREWISIPFAADAAAAVAIFIVTLIVLSAITHWVASHVRDSHFSALDRLLGFIFGLLRGAIVVCLAWMLVDWAVEEENRPVWMTEAQTLPLIKRGAVVIRDLVPEEFRDQGAAALDEAGEATRDVLGDEMKRQLDGTTETETAPPSPPADGAPPADEAPADGQGGTQAPGYNEIQRQELDNVIRNNN